MRILCENLCGCNLSIMSFSCYENYHCSRSDPQGFNPDPILFFIGFQNANKYCNKFFLFFFIFLAFYFNKLLRSHKTAEIEIFLHFFVCWWKDPDPDPEQIIRIRIREAQILADPTDPKHRLLYVFDKINVCFSRETWGPTSRAHSSTLWL